MLDERLIVVPTAGGSSTIPVIRLADRVAQVLGAEIEVLSGVEDEEETAVRRAALQQLTQEASLTAPYTVQVVVEDDPGDAIAEAATRGMVCMATSAKLLPHDGHFGSYAEHALRHATHPVMLVGPTAEPTLDVSRAVVPVDGSELSERAVPLAADLAESIGAQLWVVTVVNSEQMAAAQAAGVEIESGYVRRLARPYGGQWEVLHGDDPAEQILDFAGPTSVIAMSSHGRSGLLRLVSGSVTMAVVAGAGAPVVVVPPKYQPAEGGK